jgi:hypothetical protein
METILRRHITAMPKEKWSMYHQADVFITATDALKFGIIHEIGNFAPPVGSELFNI